MWRRRLWRPWRLVVQLPAHDDDDDVDDMLTGVVDGDDAGHSHTTGVVDGADGEYEHDTTPVLAVGSSTQTRLPDGLQFVALPL